MGAIAGASQESVQIFLVSKPANRPRHVGNLNLDM
jgi:hypothetical protein